MPNLLIGWKPGQSEFVFISPEERRVSWDDYRDITGFCETCGHAVKNHPQCQGCGVWCGIGHQNSLSRYRGHQLCGRCIAAWKILDRVIGRRAQWEEFQVPKQKMFEEIKKPIVILCSNCKDFVVLRVASKNSKWSLIGRCSKCGQRIYS